MTTRRLIVNSRRNSVCGSARLKDLDWENWFTDRTGQGCIYLHVLKVYDDTWHRVFCRLHSETPRLEMVKGRLYWLIDEPDKEC